MHILGRLLAKKLHTSLLPPYSKKTEKMFIMKKVDMYGVQRVQIDDGAQNGPGHLLKIFFCQKGHDHSISYLLSGLQTITSVLCHMHGVRRCFLLNSKMYANFKKNISQYYYHFDVIFYSRVSFWNKVVTWHLYKITVDPHKHKKMSGYVCI